VLDRSSNGFALRPAPNITTGSRGPKAGREGRLDFEVVGFEPAPAWAVNAWRVFSDSGVRETVNICEVSEELSERGQGPVGQGSNTSPKDEDSHEGPSRMGSGKVCR
jgi:hypothetical protein